MNDNDRIFLTILTDATPEELADHAATLRARAHTAALTAANDTDCPSCGGSGIGASGRWADERCGGTGVIPTADLTDLERDRAS